jgi:hypothetical protein
VTDASSIYQRARADVAAMLGYDLDNLTPEQATRLDVSTALRVLLDNQSARLVRGESLDARELLMASEALSRLLPPLREPPPVSNAPDARQIMWETYKRMRDRGELAQKMIEARESDQLRARIAELEAALAVSGGSSGANAPVGGANATAADNVVELRDNLRQRAPSPQPPKPATGGLLTDDEPEPWRQFSTDVDGVPLSGRGGKYWGPV